MEKQRLTYIDQLRGIAIFLVVMGHILEFSLHLGFSNFEIESSWIYRLIYAFHMPLFMFLAGFVGGEGSWRTLKKKAIALLIPYLSVGCLFIFINRLDFSSLFFTIMKRGYWFTFCLFEIYCVYCLINRLLKKVESNLFWDAGVYIFCSVLLFLIDFSGVLPDKISNLLMLKMTAFQFLFFAAGILVHKYEIARKIMGGMKGVYSFSLFVFACIFYISVYGDIRLMIFDLLFRVILAATAIQALFFLIYNYTDRLLGKKVFVFLGKYSLEIYLFHFFFLFDLNGLNFLFREKVNFPLLLFIVILASVLVILSSLFLSFFIKKSPLLAFLLLGKRLGEQ